MSKEERYVEHTAAWELPNGDSVTKSNYNLADIETKYMPIQTEVICDDKDKTIADLKAKLAESESKLEEYKKCNCKECMTDYEKNLNQIIDKFLNENIKLKQQLAISEKALELACEPRDDWDGREYSGTEYDNYYDYFMAEAKEVLENE